MILISFNVKLVWHFYKTPGILRILYPSLLWKVNTSDQDIYITFDDGPVPRLTPYVLDVLSDYGAKATFFCVGDNIRKHPDEFGEIIQQGHAVGNHTFNHLKAWKTDHKDYLENIRKCDEIIERAGVKQVKLFRPPYGQLTPGLIGKLKKSHLILMWDVLTYDFSKDQPAEIGLKRSISSTSPGSIIVFHDNFKAESNLRYMLPDFLEHFASLGYNFKNLASLKWHSEV